MRRARRSSRHTAIAGAVMLTVALMVLPSTALAAVTTSRVSVATGGGQGGAQSDAPAISADGRFVAFASASTTLVAGDTNGAWDVFVHDRLLGTTQLVSVATDGTQGNANSGDTDTPAISADGRYVAFISSATNLVPNDTNGYADVFVRDRLRGTTERVSVATSGTQGDRESYAPAISADGRYVAFDSPASNLVTGDSNVKYDVFVHDRQLGTTERVSVTTGGGQASGNSNTPSISGNGRFVTFESDASDLVPNDSNEVLDVFVHDRLLDTTERVSVATGGGQDGGGGSWSSSISADGRYVAFQSAATTLVAGDTNGVQDVFVRDRKLGTTQRVSVATGGGQAIGDDSGGPAMSADGRYVTFWSLANNLVPGDTNGRADVFVHDLASNITERVSTGPKGAQGNDGDSPGEGKPVISADGRVIAFDSYATNLVVGDTNGQDDVFAADRGQLSTKLTRTPSGSSLTYTRRHGVVSFTLSVRVMDARGVKISGMRVRLQSSKNGRTKWANAYKLNTNASGSASVKFKAVKHSVTYYRWVAIGDDARSGATSKAQRVRVK